MQHFYADMKRKNKLRNADIDAQRRLLERWYDDSRFSYSEAVWHDFNQRSKLGGKL